MKEIVEVLLQLGIFNELRDNEAGRRSLSVGSQRISLPETALASNEEQAAKDVEAQSVHVRSNEAVQKPDFGRTAARVNCFGLFASRSSVFLPF
jgi:hypothetical protein